MLVRESCGFVHGSSINHGEDTFESGSNTRMLLALIWILIKISSLSNKLQKFLFNGFLVFFLNGGKYFKFIGKIWKCHGLSKIQKVLLR